MAQASKEEIEKFCNEVRKQRSDITKDELKVLLAGYLKRNKVNLADAIQQAEATRKNRCAACGADNEMEATFCTSCGKKSGATEAKENSKADNKPEIQEAISEQNEELKSESIDSHSICKSCGAELTSDAAFCVSCGKPINEDVKKKKHHFVGVICSYCDRSIEFRDAVTVCPECGEPHHTKCWEDNNYTCSMPDCGGREKGVVDNTNDSDINANLATTKNNKHNRSSQNSDGRRDAKMKNASTLGKLSKKLKIAIGIGIALILGLFVVSSMGKSDMDINELKEAKVKGNAISVIIRKQYNENPAKADEWHRGRVVLLSGYVSNIEKSGGRYKVSIDDSPRFLGYNVYCFFDQNQAKEVGKLKIGDKVKIKTVHSNKGGNLDFSPAIIMAVE